MRVGGRNKLWLQDGNGTERTVSGNTREAGKTSKKTKKPRQTT